MKRLDLITWASRLNPAPHPKTLQRWAREGRIYPPPQRIGKRWYVVENAEPVENARLMGRI